MEFLWNLQLFEYQSSTCNILIQRWQEGNAAEYEKCICFHSFSSIQFQEELNCVLQGTEEDKLTLNELKEFCENNFCDGLSSAAFCWCDMNELALVNQNYECEIWANW